MVHSPVIAFRLMPGERLSERTICSPPCSCPALADSFSDWRRRQSLRRARRRDAPSPRAWGYDRRDASHASLEDRIRTSEKIAKRRMQVALVPHARLPTSRCAFSAHYCERVLTPNASVAVPPLHVIRGSVSKLWKGGGDDNVHSSVVAPAPHGLAAACRLRAKA